MRQIIDTCHEEGIRVIARTDFSKVHYDLYEQHPECAYRTAKGEIVNYNGYVHVWPNGEYQQKIMFEILEEVLTTHPFDGVFFNMSGFLVMDYSGNSRGPVTATVVKRSIWKFKAPKCRKPAISEILPLSASICSLPAAAPQNTRHG